ncbi:dynamin family protein [Micromonospora sp. NPDC049374]|uniref:dynamin family protein n=1 Tax=Micromonospora sp. NPDC049374 TaxID=3154352 RepID=UPI0034195B4D
MSLVDRTRAVLDHAVDVYRGTPHEARLDALRDRLDEPLRVAIAGRIKAGKSTLLNALVGERLAPTDAGECTRVVTWYQDGHTYQIVAHPHQGLPRQVRFSREAGAIDIDLGDLSSDDVAQLEVSWPSQALRPMTLIDTPGIGSLSEQVSQRSWDLLVPDDQETPADAVIYLMRHLHSNDVDFLRAFHDVEVSRPNPVNAIGVLSRADEIAVGRLDAMASARRIAGRLGTDPSVRKLVQSVVPVAGLLAETAATLTEVEFARLRRISELPAAETEQLLLSADRFVQSMPELGMTSIEREELLARFGMFGLRLSAALLRHGTCGTATELARELTERSGLAQLREVLGSLFLERRDVLKSRSALLALAEVTRLHPRSGSGSVAGKVEEIIASAHPFNELRVLSGLRAGWVTGKPDVVAELEQLIGGSGAAPHQRLRLPPDASDAELDAATDGALARWQRRAENPLTSPPMAVAARVAVRSCEGMIADRHRSR